MLHPDLFDPQRRTALLRLGALAPAALMGSAWAADAPASMDERQRRFLLMRGALDDRLVVGQVVAHFHALVDGEMTPLCGLLAATFTRWRRAADGRWISVSFEHVYYTDLDHTAVLTEWRNPLTGRTVPVPPYGSRPAKRSLRPDLSFDPGALPPGASVENHIISAREEGGEQVFVERVNAQFPRPGAKPYRYGEVVTLRAPLSALRDPQAQQVPCMVNMSALSAWRPWMQMGEQDGQLVTHGGGRYGIALSALHPVWLAAAKAQNVDWLADPGRRLAPLLDA